MTLLLIATAAAGDIHTWGFDVDESVVLGQTTHQECATFVGDLSAQHRLVISQPESFAEIFAVPTTGQTDLGLWVTDQNGKTVACNELRHSGDR